MAMQDLDLLAKYGIKVKAIADRMKTSESLLRYHLMTELRHPKTCEKFRKALMSLATELPGDFEATAAFHRQPSPEQKQRKRLWMDDSHKRSDGTGWRMDFLKKYGIKFSIITERMSLPESLLRYHLRSELQHPALCDKFRKALLALVEELRSDLEATSGNVSPQSRMKQQAKKTRRGK